MAERQKGKAFSFGGKSTTTITHTNTSDSATIVAVIEDVSPTRTADKAEFRDGDGDVNGVIYTNERTELQIDFYVSESNLSATDTSNARAFAVGDKLTFDDTGFAEIDDGSHSFLIDSIQKQRRFGEVRRIQLTLVEYANDVTGDPS